MAERADIVIVGAGIAGLCSAYQIARRSTARIVVLEKGRGPGEGSTGASSAVCRYRYSHPDTIRLAIDGIHAYRHWAEFLDLPEPQARFHNHGVLWLSDGRLDWPGEEVTRMAGFGVRTQVLTDEDLAARFPALNPCIQSLDFETGAPHPCEGGGLHFFEPDAGFMDPVDTLQDLVRACRARGVDVRFSSAVTGFAKTGDAITGVRVADGTQIACAQVVCAAGPWCHDIFRLAGLLCPWPLKPVRIQMIHLDRPESVAGPLPVAVDLVTGIYFRTQNRGQQLILGSVLEEDEREVIEDPDALPATVDDEFARAKLHALEHRLRGFDYGARMRSYCGLYTVNMTDVHPLVGPTPIDGLLVANGFSGHGFKLGPAIGSLIAQCITGGRLDFDTDVGLDFLAFDRSPIDVAQKSVLA